MSVTSVTSVAWRLRHFGNEEQGRAVAALQRQVWLQVVARFEALRDEIGLRQSDLARSLGVSRPQIHEWLSDPANVTLKAAGRLLLAMDGELSCKLVSPRGSVTPPHAAAKSSEARTVLVLAGLAAAFFLGGDPAIAAPQPIASLRALARPEAVAAPGRTAVALFWKAHRGLCLLAGAEGVGPAARGHSGVQAVSIPTAARLTTTASTILSHRRPSRTR